MDRQRTTAPGVLDVGPEAPPRTTKSLRTAVSGSPPDAYPVVARRGPGGNTPAAGRDVETVAAWTLALSAFLPRHAAIFKADTFIPLCESYFDDTDREVRFMLTLIGQLFSGRAG